MAELKDVLAYLLHGYPNRSDLSNARVTKMVYLSDWRHSITRGHQITDIHWTFDNYGPFVWDVKQEAEANPNLFRVEQSRTAYGNSKTLISMASDRYSPRLTAEEKASIQHVLNVTHALSWDQFIQLVYSTYPIRASERYSQLDLPALAAEYQQTAPFQNARS
jgi:hypothetical protein